MRHIPVLLKEILNVFDPFKLQKNIIYFDGTFGRGGHYQAIKTMIPQIKTIALDQDPQAIEEAQLNFKQDINNEELILKKGNFEQFSKVYGASYQHIDFALLDLGVSSPQLDEPHRGFSFYHDGPLDMRMNNVEGITAADVVNSFSETDLAELFQKYGEVSNPFRVVRAITSDRKVKEFKTTKDLSQLIERVDGWRRKGFHPATQYFMALRLVVNRELDVLHKAIPEIIASLRPQGRLAVITFHSLEDRIIKNIFKELTEVGEPLHKKVIKPTREEEVENPRSRSSKLRIFVKK